MPFGTLRRHILGAVRKTGCSSPSGNARRRFRGEARGAALPHTPPTLHRTSWPLLSPPTSSLAPMPSSSACRACSPTRTPVGLQLARRDGRVAKRTFSDDTTAAGTARPGAARRERRFRRPRTDKHSLCYFRRSAAARKNVKAARNVQVRPRQLRFVWRYLATRGVSELRKRDAGAAPDVARARAVRARERSRARRASDSGDQRVLSSRFQSVPRPGDRAYPRPCHPTGWFECASRRATPDKWLAGFRTTNAPVGCAPPWDLFFVLHAFFRRSIRAPTAR